MTCKTARPGFALAQVSSLFLLVSVGLVFLAESVLCQSRGCLTGWFGKSCQYKCHCANKCDQYGLCENGGRCENGWFGPFCQYQNLASRRYDALQSNQGKLWLFDENDVSCNTGGNAFVSVSLARPYPFTWLRLHGNDIDKLKAMTVSFQDENTTSVSCASRVNYVSAYHTVDVHCALNVTVTQVLLSGEGVKSLCSLYISGGRNVALKQRADQSSTYHEKSNAENAVDGDTTSDWNSGSCTHTNVPDNSPRWQVAMSQPQLVNRYVLYNRDKDKERLQGFILGSFNGGKEVFKHIDQERSALPVYTLVDGPGSLVSQVGIVATYGTRGNGILTLCEVEIFGDAVCDTGKYGRECEHTCNCAVQGEMCHVATGMCPSGCAPGFHWEACITECLPDTFGVDCGQTCSSNCLNQLCHHVTGVCTDCLGGKQGNFCDEDCPVGSYGSRCAKKCSATCGGGGACHPDQGTCTEGCQDGYKGPMCNETCEPKTYGNNCSVSCSQFCLTNETREPNVCHHQTGACLLGCQNGYKGLTCMSQISSSTVSVGAVAGPIIVIILVILAVFIAVFVWRRHKRVKTNSLLEAGGRQDMKDSTSPSPAPVRLSTGLSNSPGDNNVTSEQNGVDVTPITTPAEAVYSNTQQSKESLTTIIAVGELGTFLRAHVREELIEQFKKVPANSKAPMTIGLSAENKHKNRYKNISAYDHSRVQLVMNVDKKHGDYINASYIRGYEDEKKFIASQGPNKVILEDFVRMMWEQKVDVVVMLTNLVEEGKVKCERYWPEDSESEFGEIKLRLLTMQTFAHYTIRRLELMKVGQVTHTFTHFHFTCWPDKGVPSCPWPLVDLEMRVMRQRTVHPILVHCSAGVGRTGTFIALCNLMESARESGKVNFCSLLTQLRQDRVHMIQTAEQYVFLHEAVNVGLVCDGTTVTTDDMEYITPALMDPTSSMAKRLDKEFKDLCDVCANDNDVQMPDEIEDDEASGVSIYQNSRRPSNKMKNRFSNILPKESHRPYLSQDTRDMGDYINAVMVPSMAKPTQNILSQLPLPSTVTDLWRLVIQFKVTLIVAFEMDSSATDQTIGEHLPPVENKPWHCGCFEIETGPVTSGQSWEEQELSLTVHKKKKTRVSASSSHVEEHQLTHIKCTTTALSPESLLTLVNHVRSHRCQDQGRTLYLCRNGAEYSGLVCVLGFLLDRVDSDHSVSVPLVVGGIKSIRPQVIPTLDQYRLLYQTVVRYVESSNVYCNTGPSTETVIRAGQRSASTGESMPDQQPVLINNQPVDDHLDYVNTYANSAFVWDG